MKDFMLLYKGVTQEWYTKATPAQLAALGEKWGAWMANLQKTDQLVSGGAALVYSGKKLTKGGGVVTDIAAAEMKELVTGYSVVRANDEAEATAIASSCPIFTHDGAFVEVREVMKM